MKKSLAVLGCLALSLFLVTPTSMAEQDIVLDVIDLGDDLESYDEHDGIGWGPVEPDEHGGFWGDIANDPESIDRTCRVIWYNESPTDDRSALITLFPHPGSTRGIVLRVLDGVADDSFTISVLGKRGNFFEVFSYTDEPPINDPETWYVYDIDIPVNQIKAGRPLIVKIRADGDQWSGFNTYGQVAVDWIELWGNGSN